MLARGAGLAHAADLRWATASTMFMSRRWLVARLSAYRAYLDPAAVWQQVKVGHSIGLRCTIPQTRGCAPGSAGAAGGLCHRGRSVHGSAGLCALENGQGMCR